VKGSFDAADFPQCERQPVLPRLGTEPRRLIINEALTVPVRTEAASRSTSSH
jgi:hypothetical protein